VIRLGDRRRPSHDRWLISYADFITLLFAVFVVLYAASLADKKRSEVSDSIDAAFRALGIFSDARRNPKSGAASSVGKEKADIPMNIVMGEDVLAPARVKEDLNHLGDELQQTLSNQVATHTVSIKMGRDGLTISLREAGFFASGSAMPKPETIQTLRKIADSLSHTGYDLRIEGHTDNVPIQTAEFSSNWELSTARATSVARLLLALKALPEDRISASGYAGFHPVASNDTAEGRAQNRRVDLVVLPRTKVNFAEQGPTESSGAWRRITDEP